MVGPEKKAMTDAFEVPAIAVSVRCPGSSQLENGQRVYRFG